MGLEPMTSCVTGRRSNLAELTHQKISVYELNIFCCRDSGERGIRTPGTFQSSGFQDQRIRPLYHLTKNHIFV